MLDVYIQTNEFPEAVQRYAEVLGGICQNEAIGDRVIESHYRFPIQSMAEQFDRSVRVFPEVINIGTSPDLIAQAIANSKLCKCGVNTLQDCNIQCTSPILDLRGDHEHDLV